MTAKNLQEQEQEQQQEQQQRPIQWSFASLEDDESLGGAVGGKENAKVAVGELGVLVG